MDGRKQKNPALRTDVCEMLRSHYWEERCKLAEEILKHVFTHKEIGRACHIHDLEGKVHKLQAEITQQREAAEYRNHQLKATNLIVLCSGGCDDSLMGSPENVDVDTIVEVERIAARLRVWWLNYSARKRIATK